LVSITYFSEIEGKRIVDIEGKEIGVLVDLVLSPIGEKVPEVSHIAYSPFKGSSIFASRKILKFPWKNVNRISRDEAIFLDVEDSKLNPEKLEKEDILLAKTSLDKQLVDTDGLKVVRVNDIALSEMNGRLLVMSFDVGIKGILRRTGFRRVGRLINLKDHLVPWRYVQPIDSGLQHIHVKIQRTRLRDLRPADIAAAMMDFDRDEKDAIFANLDTEKAADIFELASPAVQQSFLSTLPDKRCAQILEKVAPNKAAMILRAADPDKANRILSMMADDSAAVVRKILSFRDNTAGSVMRANFVCVQHCCTVAQVAKEIKKKADENIGHHIVVVDDSNRLLGVVRMRDLLIAPRNAKVLTLMSSNAVSAPATSTLEHVAEMMEKYEVIFIPLVDSEGKVQGVAHMVDIVDALLPTGWKKRMVQRFFGTP